MSAAARSIVLLALALSACSEAPKDAETNNAAVTEVESLPADESVTTPTDELANGAAEPQGNGPANGY
jgi:starvation-inducible outer membrane lipoprotein